MIKHYLKTALKSFSRNRFVTFINIFGISFTLLVVTILFAFIDLEWGTDTPYEHKYETLTLNTMEMIAYEYDTIYHLDSTLINNTWTYDTLDYTTKKGEDIANALANPSFSIIKKYLSNVRQSDNKTFFTSNTYNIFLPSGKLSVSIKYTDGNYWDIFPYKLLEGRFYNEADIKNKEAVIVITQRLEKKYFGDQSGLNKTIRINGTKWTVIGIVQNPKKYISDGFVPYTHLPNHILNDISPLGRFTIVFLAKNKHQIKKIKSELKAIQATIEPFEDYTEFFFFPETFPEKFATNLMNSNAEDASKALQKLKARLSLFGLFFILLPLLNLLNINLSRVFERKSEIGIRKSFGANTTHIFYQFLFENILLSLAAGVIALGASYFVIHLINQSEVLDNSLYLNPTIIFWGLVASFVFGILFGVLPAIRLSKLNIVNALKN